jgi:hypothetical protein
MIGKNDPIKEAEDFINNVSPLLSMFFDINNFHETIISASKDIRKFVNAPRTFFNDLENYFKKNLKYDDKIFQEELIETLKITEEFMKRNEKEITDFCLKSINQYGSLKSFLLLFINEIKQNGGKKFKALITYFEDISIYSILGVYPGVGKILINNDLYFEEKVGIIASQMSHIAEKYYKQMIFILLKITRLIMDNERNDQNGLGQIINNCKNFWEKEFPQFLPILNNEIKILRNSEAHSKTYIDVQNETITFINIKNNGEEEIFGPLSVNDFQLFVKEFMKFIQNINFLLELIKRLII